MERQQLESNLKRQIAKEMEMATTQTVLQGKDTVIEGELYMSFELSDKQWKVTASDGVRGPSRYTVEAGDTAAVADCVRKAKQRCKLEPTAPGALLLRSGS